MTQKKSTTTKNPLGLLAGMDKDIESAKHDEIMIWLDTNLEKILMELFPDLCSSKWEKENSLRYGDDAPIDDASFKLAKDYLPTKKPFSVMEKLWEWPLRKDSTIIGFVDMLVVFRAQAFRPGSSSTWSTSKYEVDDLHYCALFEAKTTINLGQLIRQLNFYKVNFRLPDRDFYISQKMDIVVSPDNRYKKILNEQGIHYVEYKPKKT